METLEEKKKNLRRLLKASRDGDVAAVRALLESGNGDVNGVDNDDAVRLGFSFCSAPNCRLAFARKRVGAVDVAWDYGLTAGFIMYRLSAWKGCNSFRVITRSFAGRGAAPQGRR
jgi:hypothetical protein